MRGRMAVLAGMVAAAAMIGAPAAADEPATPAAGTPVPMPDLGIAHRLADGGMNLFRMPLSELEEGYGEPELVRRLPASQGWRYDRAVVLPGDFGDITAGDDGTTDFVIWHATADGSIKVWAVGGGSDPRPRLWHTLPRSDHWYWAHTRPVVGDVDGDGWDDVVVHHQRGASAYELSVLWSDGQRLAHPQSEATYEHVFTDLAAHRSLLGDLNGDGLDDWIDAGRLHAGSGSVAALAITAWVRDGSTFELTAAPEPLWSGLQADGWSVTGSRQISGDVTGDGLDDVVTVHSSTDHAGPELWVHPGCGDGATACLDDVQFWDELAAGGWSYANSRQYLADTDGDEIEDLVTVHRGGTGGLLVWRHVSNGLTFGPPELVADLRTGGWRYASQRAGVADVWGVLA